jgi:hypothetical protein
MAALSIKGMIAYFHLAVCERSELKVSNVSHQRGRERQSSYDVRLASRPAAC